MSPQLASSELEQLVENLHQKVQEQQEKISYLKGKVEQCSFSIYHIKNNDSDIEFYTGFSNYSTFKGALQSFFSRKATLSIVYIFLLLSLLDMRTTACMCLPVCGSTHTHGYCM
jgi:hypothetical protein